MSIAPDPASTSPTLAQLAYRHPVMITEAPPGTPSTALGQLATPDLRTVVYVPSPERRHDTGVASEALEALGKRNDVTGRARNGSTESELVSIWLTAHRTQHLIATACQRSPAADLLHLVEMAQISPTNLIFACDNGFADTLMNSLEPAAPVLVPWPDHLTTTWTSANDGHDSIHETDWSNDNPVLPAVEYWTFYATARRQLTPTQFQPIHDLYCDTLKRLTTWITHLTDAGHDLTVASAHDSIKTLIEEQTTFDHITTVTRAAQAAYHRAGWFLDIDERELRNGLIRFPPSKTTPDLYDRLRAYRETTRAATVALYLAGATPEAIRATSIDDLAQWHHNTHHHVAGVPVPDPAAPFLRAALLARATDGAKPDDTAFPGDTRRINLDIRRAAADLDLNIGDANLNETSTIGSRRVPATIVKLESLT